MEEQEVLLNQVEEENLLEQFGKYLRYERAFSPLTVGAYLRDAAAFFSEVYPGEAILAVAPRVTPRAVRAWVMGQVSGGMGPRTVNRHLASVSHFFHFLQSRHYVRYNPVKGVARLRVGRRYPHALRVAETNWLFEEVQFPEGFAGQRDRVLLLTLYTLGLRRSELMGLRWEDVRFGEQQVKVRGKGGRERVLPMTNELVEELCKWRILEGKHFGARAHVFLTNRGQPLTANFVYRLVRRYLEQVTTVPRRGPHALRHSYATHLLREGADIVSIKELLGHASLVSTQVYAEVGVQQLISAYRHAHPRAEGGGVFGVDAKDIEGEMEVGG